MSSNHQFRGLIAEDTPAGNDGDTPGFAQPISQSEIDDLLYGDDWAIEDRLARLRELRDEIAGLESADLGDDDPLTVVRAIDDAISRLSGRMGEGMDPTSVDHDATVHRETLSPDSDELEAIEEADRASFSAEKDDDAVDESQWIDRPATGRKRP